MFQKFLVELWKIVQILLPHLQLEILKMYDQR